MSNHKIVFLSETTENELECFHNTKNEITISVSTDDIYPSIISLDRLTAIKLSKVLKCEISKITKEEGEHV